MNILQVVGPQASGKSTWIKRHYPEAKVLHLHGILDDSILSSGADVYFVTEFPHRSPMALEKLARYSQPEFEIHCQYQPTTTISPKLLLIEAFEPINIESEVLRFPLTINKEVISLTDVELAEATNIKPAKIRRILRGTQIPNAIEIVAIAKACNTTTDLLLNAPPPRKLNEEVMLTIIYRAMAAGGGQDYAVESVVARYGVIARKRATELLKLYPKVDKKLSSKLKDAVKEVLHEVR